MAGGPYVNYDLPTIPTSQPAGGQVASALGGAAGMIPGVGNIISTALPMVLGLFQAAEARKASRNRPTYAIPPASIEALENQRRMAAMPKAPGTDAMLNAIRQSGAGATQSVKELSGGSPQAAGAVTDLYAKELNALQGQQGNQQAYSMQAGQLLNGALNKYADEQRMQWDYNINQPYQSAVATKSALTNAATSNILGGAMGALGTYQASKDNEAYLAMLKQIYSNPMTVKQSPASLSGQITESVPLSMMAPYSNSAGTPVYGLNPYQYNPYQELPTGFGG